jgi:hypothetical protein
MSLSSDIHRNTKVVSFAIAFAPERNPKVFAFGSTLRQVEPLLVAYLPAAIALGRNRTYITGLEVRCSIH